MRRRPTTPAMTARTISGRRQRGFDTVADSAISRPPIWAADGLQPAIVKFKGSRVQGFKGSVPRVNGSRVLMNPLNPEQNP
jgi:hypothetical protein